MLAASLTGLEALILAALAALELAHISSMRLTMGLTTSVFFVAAAAGLAWCAWSLRRARRWARGPVVMAQLLQLGLAWNLWTGSARPYAAAGLAVVALVVVAGLVHPASTEVLEADTQP